MIRRHLQRVGEQLESRRLLATNSSVFVDHVMDCCAGHAILELELGDLDGDQSVDFVVATRNSFDRKTGWYPNDGSGQFGLQRTVLHGQHGAHTTPGDLDGDGRVDLIGKSSWIRNLGGGHFGNQQTLPGRSSRNSGNAHPADVDEDGDLDIVYWRDSYASAVWYENLDGAGEFANRSSVLVKGLSSDNKVLNDWDLDGDLDIIVGSDREFSWHENLGDQQFDTTARLIRGDQGYIGDFIVVDLDGDGRSDIVHASDDAVSWVRNDEQGVLSSELLITLQVTNAVFVRYQIVRVADIDSDGDNDIAVADNRGFDVENIYSKLYWYSNLGDETFALQDTSPNDAPSRLYLHDVDADGDEDVIGGPRLVWYENRDGKGDFAFAQPIAGSPDGAYHLPPPADIDQDGFSDLVYASGVNIWWHPYLGEAKRFDSARPLTSLPNAFEQLALVDLDGDLIRDIAWEAGGQISWLRNEGKAQFSPPQVLERTADEFLIGFFDFDNDGLDDWVSAKHDRVVWRKNLSTGAFTVPRTLVALDSALNRRQITVADFDSDGDLDLSWLSKLYLNVGLDQPFEETALPYDNLGVPIPADIDGDGDLDVVINTPFYYYDLIRVPGEVVWLENTDDGYVPAETIGRHFRVSLLVCDIDGDGDDDLISANNYENRLVWNERRSVGDSDNDGDFDSSDLVTIMQLGLYNTFPPREVSFAEGDWNGDGLFDSVDFLFAFEAGHYLPV